MGYLPVKQHSTFKQKPLDVYLGLLLLLLLKNVMHNQSLMPHCHARTDDGSFPNFTSDPGSPFFFKVPSPETLGLKQHYQLTLADGGSTLPHWMVFKQQSHTLAGLALLEDCGMYHLKVSVTVEQCVGHFYLHILNKTMSGESQARNTLSCPEGEITTWANLLLLLNPVTLDASQRLCLVSTLAGHLHLPVGSVFLFSRRSSLKQQQNKLGVWGQSGLAEMSPDVSGDVAELLWPVCCPGERRPDFTQTLEHGMKMEELARLLEATILEWKGVCEEQMHTEGSTGSAVNYQNGQPLLQPSNTLAASFPLALEKILAWHAFQTPIYHSDVNPEVPGVTKTDYMQEIQGSSICGHPNWFPLHRSEPTGFSASKAATGCCEQVTAHTSEYFWTADFSSPPSVVLTSSTLHTTIYSSLPVTPAIYSDTSTLTHEAVDGPSQATCLTFGPHLKETTRWTEYYRASHTDSERRPTVSSLGHFIFSQEPTKDLDSALHIIPSVSHRSPLTEKHNDVLLLGSRLKTTQTPQRTRLFPNEQLSIHQRTETIEHLLAASPVMSQDAMSATTLTRHLTLSGQIELEFTPAVPSEPLSGRLDTSYTTNPLFSVEFLNSSPSFGSVLQTSTRCHDASSSLQSRDVMDFQSNSVTDVNCETQTVISGISPTPVTPAQMSFSFTPQITSIPLSTLKGQSFEDQTSVRSSHESMPFMPSLKQTTVPTLQLEQSQHIHNSSNIFFTRAITSSVYLNATTTKIDPSLILQDDPTHPAVSKSNGSVSGLNSGPTAPSTAQEPYPASSIHLLQSLEPSFPSCGQDHVYVSDCTPPIPSTYLESSSDHVLTFTASFPPTEIYRTASPSQILSFDLNGKVFSTIPMPTTNLFSDSSISMITYTPLIGVGLSSATRQSSVGPPQSSSFMSDSLNLPPKVLQSIPVLMATVGFPFLYSIPSKTFLDPEDGEADALSLEIRLTDGPPLSVGTWLALDGLDLHGVPLEVDMKFAPQHLLLVARDRQGLSTMLPMTLDLQHRPVEPCHFFTMTAKRSLHSILRHRHLVDDLLWKLSGYFNSSHSHHLSVVSMTPGSTVISWYNHTFCEMGQIKRTHCNVDQINSMWLAMVSTGGLVNLKFREAMLPEFPITKVGPVSYRQDCFTASPPPTFGSYTTADYTTMNPGSGTNTSLCPTSNSSASTSITPNSQQTNSYQWMAAMFTALLIVCLLILIILLVAVALYFCKGSGRSRTVTTWPLNRQLSVHSRDLRAIGPRRPPLRLWINLTQDDERPLSVEKGPNMRDKALRPRPPYYDFSAI
ncbi:zinc finger protein 768-like [Solea senegalensis]|uniref:Zinc finger protein 768-like n=1 Tax=Solea senegalensis TaxID=28829 RepID=A0AAV6QVP6_SOLSE|nr:uncharacterized protein LOC122766238 [Solea senegalensis]KAG7496234.1 zinc finger protein 768-like [Solea senegalensis]